MYFAADRTHEKTPRGSSAVMRAIESKFCLSMPELLLLYHTKPILQSCGVAAVCSPMRQRGVIGRNAPDKAPNGATAISRLESAVASRVILNVLQCGVALI